MSRPRVLIVTPDFPPATGGIQRLLGGLVSHSEGWETMVVTIDHHDGGQMAAPMRSVPRAASALRRASIAWLNLSAVRKGLAWRPDAVLCGHIVVSPATLLLGELLCVPTVQYVYAKELAHRTPLVGVALGHSTATIALSRHAASLARFAGADPTRIHVIPPGVQVPESGLNRAARSDPPTILTVARLADRYKGFDVMLRALPLVRARVPGARWVVIGDGPLRGELERTARAWGLEDAVLLCGRVPDGERDRWFARSHVFAMLSRLPPDGAGEGYGLVYLEAGARGLSCIAGNVGATAEAVIDGETGLLVDPTNHVEAAGALIALLRDPDRAAELGAAARERALALSWPRMADAVGALVADLIASHT